MNPTLKSSSKQFRQARGVRNIRDARLGELDKR
jgi:hypothetical protein